MRIILEQKSDVQMAAEARIIYPEMVAEIGLALRLVHDSSEFRLENSFTAASAA